MTTQHHQSDSSDWAACPPGELRRLAVRLQFRHRHRRVRQAAAGAAGSVLLLICGIYAAGRLGVSEPTYGGITCTELQTQAEEYLAKTLDGPVMASIEDHLAECAQCQLFISQLQENPEIARPVPVRTSASSGPTDQMNAIFLAATPD